MKKSQVDHRLQRNLKQSNARNDARLAAEKDKKDALLDQYKVSNAGPAVRRKKSIKQIAQNAHQRHVVIRKSKLALKAIADERHAKKSR